MTNVARPQEPPRMMVRYTYQVWDLLKNPKETGSFVSDGRIFLFSDNIPQTLREDLFEMACTIKGYDDEITGENELPVDEHGYVAPWDDFDHTAHRTIKIRVRGIFDTNVMSQTAYDRNTSSHTAYDRTSRSQTAYDRTARSQTAYDRTARSQTAYDRTARSQTAYDMTAMTEAAYDLV